MARARFLARDQHLLNVKASERSITHKFAEALQQVFQDWHVDCEYNRVSYDSINPKKLEQWARMHKRKTPRVYPDIIMHRRGEGCNAIAFEGKRSTATEDSIGADRAKLQAFKHELDYEFAVQLIFTVGSDSNISWEFVD